MAALETTDPDIHKEFMDGNFTVHKNKIPFCAVGVDHALEHINRIMKVTGGLVGITQNASARERFFLTAPELSRLAVEAHEMAGSQKKSRKDHHELSKAVWTRQEENILKLKNVIQSSMNPMTGECEDLINIITKVVMPNQVQKDVCSRDEIGQVKYVKFLEERINKNEVNLWARMTKIQLKTWKSCRKIVKHKLADKVVEMKDDRSLFARMLIVARSRPEVNLKEAIGQHEFTSLPRTLFAIDGSLLPVIDKSSLMTILEKLPNQEVTNQGQQSENSAENVEQPEDITDVLVPPKKATIIDGMAMVHAMGKPQTIKTCAQWADHFIATLENKSKEYDEIHLVFDRYDLPTSLKETTRERRQGTRPVTVYHVEDNTPVGKLSAKQFLTSTVTKDELTVYLASKALHHYEGSSKVFILALHRYHQLCEKTYFLTGKNPVRKISLKPIVHALGEAKTAALPGFHAFSGADQTGRKNDHEFLHHMAMVRVGTNTGTSRAASFKHKYVSAGGRISSSAGATGTSIDITATVAVSDRALNIAATVISLMTKYMPRDVFNRLTSARASVGVFTKRETLAVYPEYAHLANTPACHGRCDGSCAVTCTFDGRKYDTLAGVGERRAVILDDNLLCDGQDPYHGALNVLVHEFAHTIHAYGLSTYQKTRLTNAYNNAKTHHLWTLSAYSMANVQEYFAVATAIYFNVDLQMPTSGGMNTCSGSLCGSQAANRYHIYERDRELYNILTGVYVSNHPNIDGHLHPCMQSSPAVG
ncbi:hypothetical protein ScPMuIL_016529 [Solemya velum]